MTGIDSLGKALAVAAGAIVVVAMSALPGKASLLVTQYRYKTPERGLSLALADALINDPNAEILARSIVDQINFADYLLPEADHVGLFSNDSPWPAAQGTDDAFNFSAPVNDLFVAKITGFIEISQPGLWTFGTLNDDGVRVSIDGSPVISDDAFHPSQVHLGTRYLDVGTYPLDIVFFEWAGGSVLEFFATYGEIPTLDSSFTLVGDRTNGGLQTAVNQPDKSLTETGSGSGTGSELPVQPELQPPMQPDGQGAAVPEPLTIFGSALALGLGGVLKKRSQGRG